MLIRKSVKQRYEPSSEVLAVMRDFTKMVNECIRIGLAWEERTGSVPSMMRLGRLSYHYLKGFGGYSGYRLTAISKAAGILSARRKSMRRGFRTKPPRLTRAGLVSCMGFKVRDGFLFINLKARQMERIRLNNHTLAVLTNPSVKVRSFTLTEGSLSLCIAKESPGVEPTNIVGSVGIDRNLRNLTVGNNKKVTFYDITKIVKVGKSTSAVVSSFRRDDARIRKRIASKYGERRVERVRQILHGVTKEIVQEAREKKQPIVFEEIRGIRRLFRKGNGQGTSSRGRMNSWPFHEVKRQVEYKAAWEGVPVITLTRGETRGTTMSCPRCWKRFQWAAREDQEHFRQLWCETCERWMDRDVAAVLNISSRGRLKFNRSPRKEGEAREAMNGNAVECEEGPLILRVDASNLRRDQRPQ